MGDSHETHIRFKYERKCKIINKTKQLFPVDGYVLNFFPIFVSKSVNFSVNDVQHTPEGWLLIPSIFYDFLILYLNFIYSVEQ